MKGFRMKSIKYTAMAYILVAAVHVQAMNNNNNNNNNQNSPFAEMSAQIHQQAIIQIPQFERQLTDAVVNAYEADMRKLISSLDSTCQDRHIEFPRAKCYKVGQTASLVTQGSTQNSYGRGGYSSISYYDAPTLQQQQSFAQARQQGNAPQQVDESPILRGKLADILLARAVLELSHRDNGGTPDEIRSKVIADYIEHSKLTRPISDELLNQELQQLRAIQFNCTRESVATLVAAKLRSLTVVFPNTANQIPTYLVKKACAQHRSTKIKALVDELNKNYNQTLYRGV
jgi:hypothetical protein